MSGFAFAAPGLAWAAAAAVAIPVLIHLLMRRRRKPVEWAAMDLLREAIRRTERRRRVERLLLLAVRCLLVACAGFAVAEPLLGVPEASVAARARTLVAVIDDSAASAERIGDASALDRSVAAVRSAIESLSASDRVAVVTTTAFAASKDAAASLDHRASLERLRSLAARPVAGDMRGAIAAAASILASDASRETDREILVASAFRSGSVAGMQPLAASAPGTTVTALRPADASAPNLRIESLEPERTAGSVGQAVPAVLAVVARDRGDGSQRARIRVEGPSLVMPVEREVELASAERSRTVRIPVTERPTDAAQRERRWVSATLVGPDAQPLDDATHALLPSQDMLRAVVINRRTFDPGAGIDRLPAGEWVVRALSPGDPPQVDAVTVDPAALDARSLASADVAVLLQPRQLLPAQWEALRSFVARGGSLVVAPSADERTQPWTAAFSAAFGMPWRIGMEAEDLDPPQALAEEQPAGGLLASVAGEIGQLAPAVESYRTLPVDPSPDARAARLLLRDGRPFLLAWDMPEGGGSVSLLTSAVDLSWTSLPLKPLMVPLWQELAAEGRRRAASGLAVVAGARARVRIPGVSDLRPVNEADASPVRAIPVAAGGITAPVVRTGILEAVDASGVVRGIVVSNPDLGACSVEAVADERIGGWLASAGPFRWVGEPVGAEGSGAPAASAAPSTEGTSIASWLFAAALALALLEALLARRFSHAVLRLARGSAS